MIGYQQDFLEDTDNEYSINLSKDGMYLQLRTNSNNIPYYVVGFGPTEYRGFAYISIFEPKYISDSDSMLSEEYRNQFATIIQDNWALLKSNDYWKNILPIAMPNYFELKAQKHWVHNTIDKNLLFNSIINSYLIYLDHLMDFSVSISESSAYPDIIFFLVHTKECDAYVDAINFYYLTEDTLNSTYEYDFKRVIYAYWDRILISNSILKMNNKILDCCPSGLLYDPLSERY